MTLADIAVVGGGLLGRSLAWRAARAGARVALYDAAGSKGEGSAGWAAAGMIAPTTEVYLHEWLEGGGARATPTTVERSTHSVELFLEHLGEKAKKPLTVVTPGMPKDS